MAQVRGGAVVPTVTVLLLLLSFSFHFEISEAAEFVVGDDKGWSFGVDTWSNGREFAAGDVLVFKYNSTFHNVIKVNKVDYNSCKASKGSKTYTSGNDRFVLIEGLSYFLCGIPGHCDRGMKIEAYAAYASA